MLLGKCSFYCSECYRDSV